MLPPENRKRMTIVQRSMINDKPVITGFWENGRFKKMVPDFFPRAKIKYYRGRVLRGASFHLPPNTYINEQGKVTSGLEVTVFENIAYALKFDYVINTPSDGGKWGEQISPGVFNGIVGDVTKKIADVGWANIWVVPARTPYIDFSKPYYIDYACYLVSCIIRHNLILPAPSATR